MAHLNVKPLSRTQVYETPTQAIGHVIAHKVWSKSWDFGGAAFGRTVSDRRKIDNAIKAKDYSAFTASKRRGYWKVEIAG